MGVIKMKMLPYRKNLFFLIGLFFAFLNFESLLADVGTPLVIVIPDTSNNYAEYQIYSQIGSQGSSNDLEINNDTIYVEFDTTTGVPSSISSSYISVNGTGVSGTVAIRGQILAIPTPVAIERNGDDSIRVVISASAEIRNPTVSGDHTLFVWTTGQNDGTPVESDAYTIYQSISTVTSAAVTPNPSIAGLAAAYTIGFNVGGGGSLAANSGTITIAFDTSTTVPTGSISGVTVNGTSANTVASSDTVVITTPVDIDNDGSVQVVFASGAGLMNPPLADNYVLKVWTSTEMDTVDSDSFTVSLAGQLSISAITTKPDTVNQSGAFGFDLVTGSEGGLAANTDSFIVIFQQNTYLPSSISTANVSVSSGGNSDIAGAIKVLKGNSADDDTVYIETPFDIEDDASVSISFSAAAGYQNPSIAANYTFKLATNAESTPVTSNPFSVFATSTQVSQALVTPSNSTPGATTTYTVDFNLGRLGRLVPDSSTITITFPSAFSLSTTAIDYDSSYITIAGGTAIQLDETDEITVNNSNKTITVTLPASALNQNSNNINLHFGGNNPITNPSTTSTYQINVRTSVETSNVSSASFSIGGTEITINDITRSDSTVNSASLYDFDIDIQTNLRTADNDNISIVFPAGTVLPATISTSDLSINGSAPSEIIVNTDTRTVTATINQNVNINQNPHNVVIDSTANIINPAVPSSSFYRYTLNTSKDNALVTSDAYEMVGGSNPITAVSATANPSVVDASNVAYTVNFTTSSTGKLVGGAAAGSSTITVDFDDATVVPATIAAGNVEINSTALSTVTVDATGQGGTVTLTMPNGLTIGNSSSVTVLFKSILGFSNTSTAGTYNITVKTTSDTVYSDITGTAGDYVLTATQNLSITSVTPTPTTQNANASYSIRFTSGSVDRLIPGDSIRIVFPSNTYLPVTLSTNDLTINGSNPATITTQDDTMTVTLAVGDTVFILDEVTILINQAAGILNPTTVQSYTLEVITSAEPGPFTSPSYNITQTSSTVSAPTVSPSPVTPGNAAMYTVNFNVGSNGRLITGVSTITVTFNANTTVSTTAGVYDSTYITVDGSTVQIPADSISASGKAVTMIIPPGVSVDNNDAVSLLVYGTTGPIVNPASTGDYTLQVKTSVETSNITSNTYTITTAAAVTNITVNVTTNDANAESEYYVNFRVQNTITSPGGTITITFPSNTLVPSSITNTAVQIAHATEPSFPTTFQNSDGVSTNPATRAVTIDIPAEIANTDSVRVQFLSSAGIENPSVLGDYTLNVRTSSQNVDGTSATYAIGAAGTTILNLSLTITPPTASVNGEYEYHFNTGNNGRLVSGSSQIFLVIPHDATFTQGTPSTSRVTVNSTAADALELRTNASGSDTLIVTVPTSVTIGNMTNVTVIIDVNASLQNASDYTSRNYEVYTSVEGSADLDMSLPVELTNFSIESKTGVVYLNWTTASELENAYWMIQRLILSKEEYNEIVKGESKIEDVSFSFEIIDYVDARGSVSVETNYIYVDSLVNVGSVYAYRLADVSYSGVITFHEILFQEITAPEAFKLFNNYPNPFNPSTTIKYSLPLQANVELKVFNLLGQEVITLVNGTEEAGFHQLQWNGTNTSGNMVASGVYFVYFNAGNTATGNKFSKVMKVILLR